MTKAHVIIACTLFPLVAPAQESLPYRMPPESIARIADAPPTPMVSVDPTKRWLLLLDWHDLSTIAELARPELRLAGLRIDPRTNAQSRRRLGHDLTLVRVEDGFSRAVEGLPSGARIDDPSFSPDGTQVAFTHTDDSSLELWVLEVATGRARRLLTNLNGVLPGAPYRWRPDSRSLVARTVPDERGPAPERPAVPAGPVVQETTGEKAAARTYQDLLETPHDEALFAHYATAAVVEVNLDGTSRRLGGPALYSRAEPSPGGNHLLVERLERPFSYLVPYHRFPHRVEVWDRDGGLVREIAKLDLAENVPIGRNAVPTGPREHGWRADADATLHFVEAQDGGDPRAEAEIRDRLFTLEAPFADAPKELAALALRFREVYWGRDDLALVKDWWWENRAERILQIAPGSPDPEATVVFDYSYEDRYSVPGEPWTERSPRGTSVLATAGDGRTIFLSAEGASPEGNRPFVDAYDLDSGERVRLFHSEAPYYEVPIAWIDPSARTLLTRRESREEPPNFFARELGEAAPRALTDFPHPYPGLLGVTSELVRYDRADGVQLTATLHLPPGDDTEEGPLPLLVWAYPREYKSADAAAQVRESPYTFPRVSWGSPLYWLTRGYAVMENATMPIVGEGDEEPNDTYVEQLVGSAQAAVDEAVRRGVADPDRVGIGGHSYGAFMTANLLAHSDIFRAGIARSGAYNRTLTPFGFQSEQRTFWEAPEIYFAMSPFMHADDIDEPILLVHGEADDNSGTFPIQSDRLYHALKGHGAKARLVVLPHESHGYRARESVMHTLWEQDRWLEEYVKNAPPREASN